MIGRPSVNEDTVVPKPIVRPLDDGDQMAMFHLADADRAQSIFLIGNMLAYGFTYGDLRFWGLCLPDDPAHLAGTLMVVGASANLFTLPDADPAPLIELLLARRLRFVMGGAATMQAVIDRACDRVRRIEDHRLAALAPKDFRRHLMNPPAGVRVRRAGDRDVTALAHLYFGTAGFEQMSFHQVLAAVDHRVSELRAYVAYTANGIAAVAATSAETHADAMIGGVLTAPWARGQGMATTAVATLCDELIHQHQQPHLFYLIDNMPAARVYAKIGFRAIGDWKVIHFDECA